MMYEMFIGSIIWVTMNFAPVGTIMAEGQCLPINNQNNILFSLIGQQYGGKNYETFCLPDLRPKNKNGEPDWGNGPRAVIVTHGIYPSRP
jgi:microcystin-dependent protein